MNSRKKHRRWIGISTLIIIIFIIYILINTGISKIEVGKVYKAYVYDYDNRLTSGYTYIELIDEDSFVIFSDADIEPNPKDSFDGLYDYLSFLSVTMIQGRYSFDGEKYYFYTENIVTADYFDFEEWEKLEPKEYKENYNQYILDDRIILEKESNGYILTNDFGGGETRYLLKEVVDKDIPQSIEEFRQEYAKNY